MNEEKDERVLLKFVIDHLVKVYESNQPIISCSFHIRANGDCNANLEVVKQHLAKSKGTA